MNKPAGNNLQYSKLVLEELEERRLFSGGIEGLIVTSLDSDAQAIYRDLDANQAQQGTTDGDASAAAVEQQSQEIVFVDAAVEDYQQLVDDIYRNSDASRNIEVVVLDRDRDGIEQISTALQGRDDLDAIHIISHGSDGSVELGNTSLNSDTLAENNLSIALWANAFTETGDILIYGCNLAQSEVGKSLINELGALTLTDVAASDDLTGYASQGGDWELEFNAGLIESSVALSTEAQAQWAGLLGAPVINDTSVTIDENTANSTAVTTVSTNEGNYTEMYWLDKFDNAIYKANTDGTGSTTTILTGVNNPVGLAIDYEGGKLYWTTNEAASTSKIQSSNLDGTGVTDLVTGLVDPDNIALDLANNKMYWTDYGDGQIRRANLDGSGVESLVSGLTRAQGIALDVDSGKMYWTDYGTNKIQRANLNGSGVEDLVTGLTDPLDVELDLINNKMYWIDFSAATIQRANFDGSGVENLITTGLSTPFFLALDTPAGKMYWTDDGSNKIQRANLDGTGIEDLVTTGTDDPRDLVLSSPNNLSYSITGGNTGNAFTINASSGEITVVDSNVLDFETTPAFNLTVEVQDNVTLLTDTATISMTLNDVNEAPVATADPGAYSTDLLALNPLSYWQLGDAGVAAADLGSSTNHGTYNGGLLGQTGAINGDGDTAVRFDGLDDYVEFSHTNDYLLDDGTIQLWFNVDTAATGAFQYLFSKDSSGFDTGGHVGIYLNATGNLEVRLQSTTTSYIISSAAAVTAGDWHHATFSFGANGMELYLDGAIAATDIYMGGLGTTSGGTGNYEPIAIGGSTTVSDDLLITPINDFFTGSIDEVAILGSQLDAATIKGLYAAGQQNYATSEDASLNVVASEGVLINDYDPEGDALSVVAVNGSAPGVGTAVTLASGAQVTLNADGSFSYDPNAQFEYLDVGESTTDSFNYTVSDGNGNNDTTTVTITINGAEDASTVGGTATGAVAEDSVVTVNGSLTVTDVDANDNPVSFNDMTPVASDNGYGNFGMVSNTWTYSLNNGHASVQALDFGETLTDTYTFSASDGSTQLVTVTIIGAEDAAVIGGTAIGTVVEDGALTVGSTLTITDTDANDNPIGFNDVTTTLGDNGYGYFEITSNAWTYTLNNGHASVQALDTGETLNDTYTFSASDGSTQLVTVTINGAEDTPTLDNAVADQTATEDIAFSFTFAANTFGDIDTSDILIYTATLSDNSPLPGWLNFDGSTRTFSGIPANPDVGAIDIKITADDGSSTVIDTFTLTVINAPDAPVFGGAISGVVSEDLAVVAGNISTSGILTVADPDVGESSFQAAVNNGSYGDLSIDAAGNWSYVADNSQAAIQTLDAGESLVDTLTVTSFDGTTTNVLITINGVEDAAVVGGTATAMVTEDGTLAATNSLTISDTDTSDNPVSFNDVAPTPGGNSYGNFEITANTWTYTLNNGLAIVQSLGVGASLSDTFTFTATDGSTQLVVVTINGVAEPQTAPPVADPPVFEPPPEFDSSPDDPFFDSEGAAVRGFSLESTGIDIVRVAQNSNSPSVREQIDVAAYLQQDAAETTPIDRSPSKNEQLEKQMEQRNLHLDKLTLQVSDDAELNARYEQELLDRIDRMHQGIDSESSQQNADDVEVQIIMGTSVGLTAGIVSWVLRGGSLLASLMSTVPLLNRFDPLPILKSRDKKEDVEEDKDDERTDTTIRRREKRVDGMFSGTDGARE